VSGRFLFIGEEKFYAKGVNYGAFRPDAEKREYRNIDQIERDFAQMEACGINTLRIPHTMPPCSLLDAALRHGLRVMVGISAEQYVGYLVDTQKACPNLEAIVLERVRTIQGHPGLLCYCIGQVVQFPKRKEVGRPVFLGSTFRSDLAVP
jgi:beta-galactosidase/beta-glucuronidase